MTSTNFKIGTYLGQTISAGVIEADGGFSEAGVTASGGGGSALNVYDTLDSLPTSGLTSGDQAFVLGNNRFYISNGSGWYNAVLLNAAPYWDSAPLAAYTIEDSSTALSVTGLALDSDNPQSIISYTGFASDSAQYLVNITTDSSITTFTPLSADSVANNATLGNIPDSAGGSFTYTFRATDGISTVTQASTITYSTATAFTNATYSNLNITNWDFGTAGTSVTSYNSSTKIEGSHSGYISGGGNINRQPGKGQGETAVTFSSAYCISMWVNVSAYNGSYNVAYPWNNGGKTNAGNSFGPCALSLKTDGTVQFNTANYNGSAYSGITVDVGTLTTGVWYHIIAAATPGGSTIKLWMSQEGGSFAGLANESGFSTAGGRTTIENLVVGDGANNWYLHGSIGTASDGADIYYDDVRIYDAVPSDAEAQAIFETNGDLTSTSNPLTTNLKFAYQFNSSRAAGIYSTVSGNPTTTAALIANSSPSGSYNINGVNTYFDASTGYALYSSFGTNGTYTNVYPAHNGNEIKYSELSTYGYSSPGPAYSDGTSSANFGNYTAKNGYLAFYNSGSGTTNLDLTTWNGPSNATNLRVVWGNGDVSNTGADGALYINNTSIRSSMSGEHIDTSSFSPTGSTPLLRVYEGSGSISGISQIWFKNG